MLSRTSQTYKEIRENTELLIKGTVISIDPSMGSSSSMPGWAVYDAGDLVASGTINLQETGGHGIRLNTLHHQLLYLNNRYKPQVLVFEKIPVSAHGNRSQVSHASLLMALGVTLAAFPDVPQVGIMPISWKKMVRDTYRKGDEEDAIEMGWIVIKAAMDIEEQNPKRKYGEPGTDSKKNKRSK
jgi:hypothetical protein